MPTATSTSRDARGAALLLAVKQNDLPTLRKWSAEPGGFGSDEVRQTVWPFLLGVHTDSASVEVESQTHPGSNGHHRQSIENAISGKDATISSDLVDDADEAEYNIIDVEPDFVENYPKEHPDEGQVALDTNRSFVYYPTGISSNEKDRLQNELNELIVTLLRRRKGLSYFQGYHDIISVFYLTFFPYRNEERKYRSSKPESRPHSRQHSRQSSSRSSSVAPGTQPLHDRSASQTVKEEDGNATGNGMVHVDDKDVGRRRDQRKWGLLVDCCDALSLLRIRDGMGHGLGPVVGALRILKRLLKAADPDLAKLVNQVSPMPYFALSWILTLFSHDIDILSPVQRIFDYFLARNPGIVIYLGVAIILLKKTRLMELKDTLDNDPGIMHSHLALLPPLIADGQQGEPPSSNASESPELSVRKKSLDHTVYPSKETANPHASIKLSELFQLTDTLVRRFPFDHKGIRMREVLGPKSVVFTYEDTWEDSKSQQIDPEKPILKKSDSRPHSMTLSEAAAMVDEGLNESDTVVVPAPQDSDTEEEDTWNARDRRGARPAVDKRHRRRDRIGKGLALAVLCISVGIALYRLNKGRSIEARLNAEWTKAWQDWTRVGLSRIENMSRTYQPWLRVLGFGVV